MQSKVSIIIPVYNGEKYIKDSIASMQKQTYQDIEVIYVDDGSNDNTAQILDEAAAGDDRIKVLHKTNEGVSAARNDGIKAATGEYVWFVDSDDTVEPDTIKDNIEYAVCNQADMVVFGFWYYHVDSEEEVRNEFPEFFSGSREDFFKKWLITSVRQEYFNAPWNKLIRRSLIQDNNLRFDTRYSLYEDNLFATEVFIHAKNIVVNPKPYYRYYLKNSGSLLTKFHDNIFEGLTLFYDTAMKYCEGFEDNGKQKQSFDEMYVKHTYTYLKQISCNADITNSQKRELMIKICGEDKLVKALDHVELRGRKKLIGHLIKRRNVQMIKLIYQAVNKLQ